MHEAGLFQHTHGGTGLDESGRKDCPHMRRGARFAEKLANGGGGEAATLPSRCEVWIGDDRVARQPKRFGKYVPGFGYIAAARPPERRRIVDRGVEQLQIVGHEVDERSRHTEGVSPLVRRSGSARLLGPSLLLRVREHPEPEGLVVQARARLALRRHATARRPSARTTTAKSPRPFIPPLRRSQNTARRDLAAPQTKEY